MSNLARKYQQEEKKTVKISKKIVHKKAWLSPGEKFLWFIFAVFLFIGIVKIISNQAVLYSMNKDIQVAESAVQEQESINRDLDVQVQELSNYERLLKKAEELGLQLNNDNVKAVQGE
ncbi:cell division protein FtsL [Bacillaceae bacterium Marseille-Q3522]|nr:cell division protein FtsL [Bacillaceae bacterium Marseille-Q3522]